MLSQEVYSLELQNKGHRLHSVSGPVLRAGAGTLRIRLYTGNFLCDSGLSLFEQIPDGYSIVGYILICGTAVAMYFYNNHRHPAGNGQAA